MLKKEYWIEKLGLLPHPEGGFFRETYRAGELIDKNALPERFSGSRNFSTQIYYMLVKGNFSAFHRLKMDEVWHFYYGAAAVLYILDKAAGVGKYLLGTGEGCLPQIVVPAGKWFAAEVLNDGDYTLAGCTTAPGFDFEDFELAKRDELFKQFPFEVVNRLSRE